MQYKIIDHRWQTLQIDENTIRTHRYDLANLMEIEHNENLDLFEKMIQECVAEGWTPLGAPIFSEDWYKMDCRRMYQALTKSDEKELLVADNTNRSMSDEIEPITSASIVLPKLIPHPPSRRRINTSSSVNINMKSPRMTRSERLRQEYLKSSFSKNG